MGLVVVSVVVLGACSQKQADVTSPASTATPTTATPTTATPATTAAPGTTRPAGGDFCSQVEANIDLLRDLSGDRPKTVVVFRDLAAVAPDPDIGAAFSRAADLVEENADASQAELEAAAARARDDDADFARNIARVPSYVQDECGVSISSSTETTVRRSTTTTVRSSSSTTEFDPLATTDSRDLFEGGLRSYLAQNYGDQPWYADIDRFSLVIGEDSVGQPIVQAAVGSTTTDFDEATAKDICLAVVRYAGSSELDRDVSVTGVDDRILVRTSSYRYQCTPP